MQQIIWNKAQTIAASYPAETVNKYLSAASSLRIPYWDWASDPTLPNSLVSPQINITTPAGPRLVDNPLFNYTFHPLPVGTDIPPNDPVSLHITSLFILVVIFRLINSLIYSRSSLTTLALFVRQTLPVRVKTMSSSS